MTKLGVVPVYLRCRSGMPAQRLDRYDVVDLNSFFRCRPVVSDAEFPREDRAPEPIVEAWFCKHGGHEGYWMPLSEFARVMGTELAPSIA